jgi:hypothetical protein
MAKFQKGQSGNPAGRPKGLPDRRTKLRALLEPHAQGLVEKAVERALEGDAAALRLCLDRLIPPLRAKDQVAPLPGLVHDSSLAAAGRAVLAGAAEGRLTPSEASSLIQALAGQARIVEIDELDRRVAALEEAANDH